MRKLALALILALLVSLVPVAGAGAGMSTPGDSGATAAKKKCKKGYVLKKVKKKKRVRGKVRTVRVKKCVKKKQKAPSVYRGQATGTDGVFKYGAVTLNRSGNTLTGAEIKAVTTSGCGGFMTLVFNPKTMPIIDGSANIVGGKLHVQYKPLGDVDFATTLDITFAGNSAQGTFKSEGICGNAGLFRAAG